MSVAQLPRLGFLYLDYVMRFFNESNFKGWPDRIEHVVYHWGNDQQCFVDEVKRKKIDVLIGNIPATAYEPFKQIKKQLPNVRFVPSVESQFSNKSKENVSRFCRKFKLSHPHTEIFYDREKGLDYLENCSYPRIIKRSYGPSNYGGYFVHKVDSSEQALTLMKKKRYLPIYVQECIPLTKDIRVMLIGHKPVCAFWRIAGDDQWITNTSQGGSMSYDNVPLGALELAVSASKAAKAEYFACDIAEDKDSYTILECATAFAAFSYIRDWIGQYLMWDLSGGRFAMPHIPLFSWEELGKIKPELLRCLRHIGFSRYQPSADGTLYSNDLHSDMFRMERTEKSYERDIPVLIDQEQQLPQAVLEQAEQGLATEPETLDLDPRHLAEVTLTDLMTLQGMSEPMAETIRADIVAHPAMEFTKLPAVETIEAPLLRCWQQQLRLS
ncbi:MAG: hypothetical protein J7K75_10905 [Desulfuromonas sp.]|nr:hypothetical protein [Desulfuromonas sp.]